MRYLLSALTVSNSRVERIQGSKIFDIIYVLTIQFDENLEIIIIITIITKTRTMVS